VCKRVAAQLQLDFEEIRSVALGERRSEKIERALDEAIDEVAERILRGFAPSGEKELRSDASTSNTKTGESRTHSNSNTP
jgi:hypothetical protein